MHEVFIGTQYRIRYHPDFSGYVDLSHVDSGDTLVIPGDEFKAFLAHLLSHVTLGDILALPPPETLEGS
jgi:hypothetical protein